jgi:hypothetical protein
MPQALGSKCNPADPDHAIEQLQLWRDASLYPVLAGAPNVSANDPSAGTGATGPRLPGQ